jgi:adenylosuccinate lyase
MNTALENITLWHERDISHSSAERVIFPDSCIALDYLIHRMIFILKNLLVYPENMLQNIERTGGLFYSQSLLLLLIDKGLSREESYKIVQDMTMRVWNREGSLKELALKSPDVMSKVNAEELDNLFNIDRYFKNIDTVYEKAGIK